MSESLVYNGGLTCALEVSDLGRGIAWYQEVMGFKLLYQVDDLAWCELATDVKGVNLGLSQVEKPKPQGGATLTFGVEDIAAAKRALEGFKVEFDGDVQVHEGMVKLLTFYDPDGNKLMLYEDIGEAAS